MTATMFVGFYFREYHKNLLFPQWLIFEPFKVSVDDALEFPDTDGVRDDHGESDTDNVGIKCDGVLCSSPVKIAAQVSFRNRGVVGEGGH